MKIDKKDIIIRLAMAIIFGAAGVARLVAGDLGFGLLFSALAVVFVVLGIVIPWSRQDGQPKDRS